MRKLLVVCGPTATGKTGLGLQLAKKFNGEILSADSRQVYRGMDIITGKDLPVKSKKQQINSKNWKAKSKKNIWLVDLVEPTEEFSVAQWNREARKVLRKLWEEGKLPILVGGTGFYIKAVVDGIETIDVPPNKKLREMLAGKSTEELYDMLGQLDSARAASMNSSDRRNPRRLVRAIEIAMWKWEVRGGKLDDEVRSEKESHVPPQSEAIPASHFQHPTSILMVGLTAPRAVLYQRIDERVEKRLEEGALQEVQRLLSKGVSWNAQAMQGLGYRQLRGYFEKKVSLQEAVKAWKGAEHKYARQQLTWFKRDKRIEWFDISLRGWEKKVANLIESWYSISQACPKQ